MCADKFDANKIPVPLLRFRKSKFTSSCSIGMWETVLMVRTRLKTCTARNEEVNSKQQCMSLCLPATMTILCPKSNLLKAFRVVSVWDFITSQTIYKSSTQGSEDSVLHLGLLSIFELRTSSGTWAQKKVRKCKVVSLLSPNGGTPKHTSISHSWQKRIPANKRTVRAWVCVLRTLGYIHITRVLRLT